MYLMSKPSSDSFLEHMRQDVPLNELKVIRQSCHFDANLNFCAIMCELNDEKLRELYGGRYLMEIWSAGRLIF